VSGETDRWLLKGLAKVLPKINLWRLLIVPLALSFLVGACSRPTETITSGQRESIQTRVTNAFVFTVLFKPTESATNSPFFRLAPLILQEVADTNSATLWRDQVGGGSGPVVACESGLINLNGRPHDQVSYSWTCPLTGSSSQMAQGVRMTLNAAGEPVIWEVLRDSTGASILYVAQSLELAARAEFGPPRPGRKFSIEGSITESPRTVVANVIDDGPLPMGPVIYLRKGSRDVSTLLCRCMASQGGTLLGQRNYELQLSVSRTSSPVALPSTQLQLHLRLPREF